MPVLFFRRAKKRQVSCCCVSSFIVLIAISKIDVFYDGADGDTKISLYLCVSLSGGVLLFAIVLHGRGLTIGSLSENRRGVRSENRRNSNPFSSAAVATYSHVGTSDRGRHHCLRSDSGRNLYLGTLRGSVSSASSSSSSGAGTPKVGGAAAAAVS